MNIIQRIDITNTTGLSIRAFIEQLSAYEFRFFYETWDNQTELCTGTRFSEEHDLNSTAAFKRLITFANTHYCNGGTINSVSSMENLELLSPEDMQQILDQLCPGITIEHV